MPETKRGRYVDNNDIDDEQLEPEVTMEIGYSKVIIVDNIPIVAQDKFDKLKGVLQKIFSQVGPIREFSLPHDETHTTKGYAFVEFTTSETAESAIQKINGYRLDKQHVFRVTSFDDFQKFLNVPETYQAPEVKPYEAKENLWTWCAEKRLIDQYVIRYGDWTEILWNEFKPSEDPESVMKRKDWSDAYVRWSPRGTYLLTTHPQGVAIWGGPQWHKIMRFPHQGVKFVDFSPCERFLVTASPQLQENDNPKDPQCIIVWDSRTGKKLRGFLGANTSQWPVLKWSHDDKYLARIGEDSISVYETPNMDLLDKKSIKIFGVKDFAWSPTANLISYFVPETGNQPARVALMEIPSKTDKYQKNLFNVVDCKLHWQSNGDYLAVKIERQKTKKQTISSFEIFRLREKNVPIESLELKDNVQNFAWEPKGNRFAIIHGEGSKPDVSFYALEKTVKLLKTLEKKPVNGLFWSPTGDFIVLANLNSVNGNLEFLWVSEMETIGTEEHFNCSSVEWDPTGRQVVTSVSFWNHQIETGYNVYNFQGKLLKHVLKDKFYQLLWRPRPPSLLPEDKQKSIKKNLKKYEKEYRRQDNLVKTQEEEERFKKREALRTEFQNYLAQKRKEHEEESEIRRKLRSGEDSDDEDDYEYRDEWVEEIEEN